MVIHAHACNFLSKFNLIMASSGGGVKQKEATDKSFNPPSKTLLRRKKPPNEPDQLSAGLPPSPEQAPQAKKKTNFDSGKPTRPSFCTRLLIILSVILGIVVTLNAIFAARVLFSIFQKSNAANRNKANHHGSIEIGNGVRLEEITTIDGRNIKVYKRKEILFNTQDYINRRFLSYCRATGTFSLTNGLF